MDEGLSEIRERLHRKSHEYFVFEYGRRDQSKWNLFYGATDALQDAIGAARSYGRSSLSDIGVSLLAAYGFLQALYVQQDAVWMLSRSVDLDWHPNHNPRLKEIRDVRNRLTGHPALAGERNKPPRLSSAIIPYRDIGPDGFRGHIYYDDGIENIHVSTALYIEDNEAQLYLQMCEIEEKMAQDEREFRAMHIDNPFSKFFENGFSYTVRCLHCTLADETGIPKARSHARAVFELMTTLGSNLKNREFQSDATDLYLGQILRGVRLVETLLEGGSMDSDAQYEYDLIFYGIEKRIEDLRLVCVELDEKIRAS